DEALLRELPADVDPCGENGEVHTCAWDGPMFCAPLALRRGDDVLRDERSLYTDCCPLYERRWRRDSGSRHGGELFPGRGASAAPTMGRDASVAPTGASRARRCARR